MPRQPRSVDGPLPTESAPPATPMQPATAGTGQAGPEQSRLLGRPRVCIAADMPDRLRRWHAPRINRWEQLHVVAGMLVIEYLDAGGVARETLADGEYRWLAPGTRWRVAALAAGARFELGIYAAAKGQAEAPQPLRSDLLDAARRVAVADAAGLLESARALAVGERCIVEGPFAADALPAALLGTHSFFWHPLAATTRGCVALLARSAQPLDLAAYLGRDHAVIEAALGGMLAGDLERGRWLQSTLERHLHIEEELIFPAYLEAGGQDGWVRGLENEHRYLRQYLATLDQAASRHKLLRLLDGHDEKEECIVYPDILARLDAGADTLLVRALGYPLPDAVGPGDPGTRTVARHPGRAMALTEETSGRGLHIARHTNT